MEELPKVTLVKMALAVSKYDYMLNTTSFVEAISLLDLLDAVIHLKAMRKAISLSKNHFNLIIGNACYFK